MLTYSTRYVNFPTEFIIRKSWKNPNQQWDEWNGVRARARLTIQGKQIVCWQTEPCITHPNIYYHNMMVARAHLRIIIDKPDVWSTGGKNCEMTDQRKWRIQFNAKLICISFEMYHQTFLWPPLSWFNFFFFIHYYADHKSRWMLVTRFSHKTHTHTSVNWLASSSSDRNTNLILFLARH